MNKLAIVVIALVCALAATLVMGRRTPLKASSRRPSLHHTSLLTVTRPFNVTDYYTAFKPYFNKQYKNVCYTPAAPGVNSIEIYARFRNGVRKAHEAHLKRVEEYKTCAFKCTNNSKACEEKCLLDIVKPCTIVYVSPPKPSAAPGGRNNRPRVQKKQKPATQSSLTKVVKALADAIIEELDA